MTTSNLFVDTWGEGPRVVLVHGSLAVGADEWQAQRPLADEGFRLLVPDRRGYGQSPAAGGEDFLRDAGDILELMGDRAHLVGHSYGGLGVLFAAARRPGEEHPHDRTSPPAGLLPAWSPASRSLAQSVLRRAPTQRFGWPIICVAPWSSDPEGGSPMRVRVSTDVTSRAARR